MSACAWAMTTKGRGMQKRISIIAVVALVLWTVGGLMADVFDPIVSDPDLPNVLIIGDSISMGYTPYVRTELAGAANIHRIPENGARSIDGAEKIARDWLCQCRKYDVIVFNFGLHDARIGCSNPKTPIEDYDEYLEECIAQLEVTGATLLWAQTTDVPAGSSCRTEANAALFRAVSDAVMLAEGIDTIDLLTPSVAHPEWHMPSDVHYTEAGYEALGAIVAAAIEAEL